MIFLSGIVGVLVAFSINQAGLEIEGVKYVSPAIAFIIGYAGGDFLESVYKILAKGQFLRSMQKRLRGAFEYEIG